MPRSYRFEGTWHVPHPIAEVADTLLDLEHYPAWWPEVVAVARLGPDDARVICRSVLPYSLDLVLHAERREPPVLETSVSGDLRGVVRWRLSAPTVGSTRMEFEQEVDVSGALALASYVARPLLRWNHHRMMVGCIAGLERRLAETAPSPEDTTDGTPGGASTG